MLGLIRSIELNVIFSAYYINFKFLSIEKFYIKSVKYTFC